MMYQVLGLLGVVLFQSVSLDSCRLYCRRHDLDYSCIQEVSL